MELVKLIDRNNKKTAEFVISPFKTSEDLLETGKMLHPKWFSGKWDLSYKGEDGKMVAVDKLTVLDDLLDQEIDTFYWNYKKPTIRESAARSRSQRRSRGRNHIKVGANGAPYSNLGARFIAMLIDFMVIAMFSGFAFAKMKFFGFFPVMAWLYYAGMHSSSYQASLGKMALGLKVTTEEGHQLTFGQATIRFFMKSISYMIGFIGHFFAFAGQKRQALHDRVAKTVVVDKSDIYDRPRRRNIEVS